MQELFVLFVQFFGSLNFKERRICQQLTRENSVCPSLIVLLGACCVPSGFAGTDHNGGFQVENSDRIHKQAE